MLLFVGCNGCDRYEVVDGKGFKKLDKWTGKVYYLDGKEWKELGKK